MKPGTESKTCGVCAAAATDSQGATWPSGRSEFIKDLSDMLGQRVEIIPMRLPAACTCLWLGFTGLDRIGFNAEWPGHEFTLTAHAIGHLALGHCGIVRDSGQFACLPIRSRPTCLDHDRLRSLLHDPAERLCRMFSDREEDAARVFALGLDKRLDRACGQHQRVNRRPTTHFWCIG